MTERPVILVYQAVRYRAAIAGYWHIKPRLIVIGAMEYPYDRVKPITWDAVH